VKLFVGITDKSWYDHLSSAGPDEVNFWKPGETGSFGVLQPGELFLFKLHSPLNYIVGGAYFLRFSRLPVSLAWEAFGSKNGVRSLADFRERISKYRKEPIGLDPSIGNIILTEPFWFPQDAWIPAPTDWPRSTVQGKSYDALEGRGFELLAAVRERLGAKRLEVLESKTRYGITEARYRIGQGGFRVLVTEAYQRRCAITGESTLPVLEAAHIRPYAEDGPHEVKNGILLRSDMHTLFDRGLIGVSPDYKILVSSQIAEQYNNGKRYYALENESLRQLPTDTFEQPDQDYLAWHQEHVFVP